MHFILCPSYLNEAVKKQKAALINRTVHWQCDQQSMRFREQKTMPLGKIQVRIQVQCFATNLLLHLAFRNL